MKFYSFLIIFLLSLGVKAQNFLSWQFNDRYFSALVGTGSATYLGELNYSNKINTKFSLLSFGLEARLLNHVGARLEAQMLTLSGSDSNAPADTFQKQRNLSFESQNFQVQFTGIYYIKPYQGDYFKRLIFDPYLIGGVGYMYYNPKGELGGQQFPLRKALTEGVDYHEWVLTVPFGVGAKFRVNEFLNINLEVLYHLTFSDYLDDVSATYATEFPNSTAELLSDRKDEVGVISQEFYDQIGPGGKRGDASNNDRFILISIKAEIFIPPGLFSRKNQAIIKKPSAY